MTETQHVINPETGRTIQVGGVIFYQLIFSTYDFINGELIRRTSAPPPAAKHYLYNTDTNRLVFEGSRRYNEYIRDG